MSPCVTPKAVLAGAERLPAFPLVIGALLRDLNNDNASSLTLARHIENDPVLIGRILSAANRLLRDEGRPPARDVYTAVSLIGFSRIRHIVLTTSIAHFTSFFRRLHAFWEHCLAVGLACEELAKAHHIHPDHALVGGLLHDIGKLWMAYFYPLEFQKVNLRVQAQVAPLCETETAVFGMNHCEIGEIILSAWGLPPEVCEAVLLHHTPVCETGASGLVQVVYLAELLCNALDLPHREINQVTTLPAWAPQWLPLDDEWEMHGLFGRIQARFYFANGFFQ